MQRPIVTIPRGLFREANMSWRIEWRGQESGMTIGGNPLGVANAFPRFVGEQRIILHKTAIRRWRAIQATAQGRLGIYRMWMNDPVAFSWKTAAGALANNGATFSNGEYLTTGYGVEYTPMALAVGAVSAGATEMRVDVSPCGIAPVEGQIMSADDWPFEVTWVMPVSGTIYDIGLSRLATAIADEGVINMQGYGRFELADEGQGNPAYGPDHHSTPTVAFQEVLKR